MTGRRRAMPRAALTAAGAAVALVGAPGIAAAAPSGSVQPLLDCVSDNHNGTFTAVLGYSNAWGKTVHIPLGWKNRITPSRFDGRQPTTFQPGTRHAAFSVTFTAQDLGGAWPSWTLDGSTIDAADVRSNACPDETTMPAEGNGAGAAIALAGAAGVGVLIVRRIRRRSTVTGPGDGDA